MLKQENRLDVRTSKELKNFLNTSLFTLKYDTNNTSVSRFGFIISKSIDKRAVVRNKIKRLFRASVENILIHVKSGNDFLFIVRPGAKEKSQEEIQGVIYKSLQEKELIQ